MIESYLSDIERVAVSSDRLGQLSDEGDFNEICVDFLKEAGSYLCVSCNIYPRARSWNEKEAAICGNGIRMFELLNAFLDQTCQHRREISEIISRLIFETGVTIRFLIDSDDPKILKSYILSGFKFERKLRSIIHRRIEERGGQILPIESRMIDSINNFMKNSSVSEDDLLKIERNWAGKNLYEKAQSVGWEEPYLAMFAGMSNAVHGNWSDLQFHHLRRLDCGRYEGIFDWSPPRPQALMAVAKITGQISQDIVDFFGVDEATDAISVRVNEFFARIGIIEAAHESFLQQA